MENKLDEKQSIVEKTKKRKSLWLGIGLGLILPVCAACIAVPLILLPSKIPAKNEFKFIIASGEGEGSEIPSVIHFTPEECEKYFFVNVLYNGENDDIENITVASSEPSKFGCEVERSKMQNNSLSQTWTWSIHIYANKEAALWDTADINFKITDFQKREGNLTIGVVMKESGQCVLTILAEENCVYKLNDKEITTPYSETFDPGTEIKVEAIPNSGYEFIKWNDDGSTVNPRTFTLLRSKTVSADISEILQENKLWFGSESEPYILPDRIDPNALFCTQVNGELNKVTFEAKDGSVIGKILDWNDWSMIHRVVIGNISNSVTGINDYFFYKCTNLSVIDLSGLKGINYIGSDFFNDSYSLSYLKLMDQDPTTITCDDTNFLKNISTACRIAAGDWRDIYKTTYPWSKRASNIVKN